jgi:dihydroorotate dehydrogenase
MGLLYRSFVRPALFSFECEKAHHLALKTGALLSNIRGGSSLIRMFTAMPDERLKVEVSGIKFANPIGLAAGFDKDGSACLALAALGFGHIEIGTVTTDIQPGNDSPRLFRIPHRNALVNSLGFPSSGIKKVVSRLESVRASSRGLDTTKLGVNIGKSKATLLNDAPKEYAELLRAVSSLADYVVVNVSSPNTPELRKLQEKSRLEAIFRSLSTEAPIPVFVKIAPDLSFSELDDVLEAVLAAGISGIVATNTTIDRSVCRDADSLPGGISGGSISSFIYFRANTGKNSVNWCGGYSLSYSSS